MPRTDRAHPSGTATGSSGGHGSANGSRGGNEPSLPQLEDLPGLDRTARKAAERIRSRRYEIGSHLRVCDDGPLATVKAVVDGPLPDGPEHAYADAADVLLIIDAVRERFNRQLDQWRLAVILAARNARISNPRLARLLHQRHKQGVRHVITSLQKALADPGVAARLVELSKLAERAHRVARPPHTMHPTRQYATDLLEHVRSQWFEMENRTGIDMEELAGSIEANEPTEPLDDRTAAALRRILAELTAREPQVGLRQLLDVCPRELWPTDS